MNVLHSLIRVWYSKWTYYDRYWLFNLILKWHINLSRSGFFCISSTWQVSLLMDQGFPGTQVARFDFGWFADIWEHKHFLCLKLNKIVIMWVDHIIHFWLQLFWHYSRITFQFYYIFCYLASLMRVQYMVHIVERIFERPLDLWIWISFITKLESFCANFIDPILNLYFKLNCGYIYARPCMINRILGLKQREWSCLISFAWDPLSCSEQAWIEKFKIKIYVSSGIQTYTTPQPVKQRFRPLGHDALMIICGLMSYMIVG